MELQRAKSKAQGAKRKLFQSSPLTHDSAPSSLHPSNPPGFTLLEVLVCMVLLATALVAVFRLQAQNLDLQSEARFITAARLLAQARVAAVAGDPDFREGRETGDFGEDHPGFRYSQDIRRAASGQDLYRIAVEVYLQGGRPHETFAVETLLYRGKP